MRFSVFMMELLTLYLLFGDVVTFVDVDADEKKTSPNIYFTNEEEEEEEDEIYQDLSLEDDESEVNEIQLVDDTDENDKLDEIDEAIESHIHGSEHAGNSKKLFDMHPEEHHQPDTCSQQFPSAPLTSAVDAPSGTLLISALISTWKQFHLESDQEIKKRLHEILSTDADKNMNREVTLNELSEWIMGLFESECSKYDYGQNDLLQIDTNGDNRISWNELDADFDKTYSASNGIEEDDKSIWKTKSKLRFNHADKNQDGFLDTEEMLRYVAVDNFRDMDDFNVDIFVLDHDTDRNNVVTKNEFLLSNFVDDDQFKEIDNDGDEILSRNEILPVVLQQSMSGLVRNDVQMTFETALNLQDPNYTGNYSAKTGVETRFLVSVLQDYLKKNVHLINQLLQKQLTNENDNFFEGTPSKRRIEL